MGGFLLPKFKTLISDVKDITDTLHSAKYQVINIKHIIRKDNWGRSFFVTIMLSKKERPHCH